MSKLERLTSRDILIAEFIVPMGCELLAGQTGIDKWKLIDFAAGEGEFTPEEWKSIEEATKMSEGFFKRCE